MATLNKPYKLANACSIMHEDGKSYLTDPEGKKLPKQIFVRVTNAVNGPAYAIVKILVNLPDTIKP